MRLRGRAGGLCWDRLGLGVGRWGVLCAMSSVWRVGVGSEPRHRLSGVRALSFQLQTTGCSTTSRRRLLVGALVQILQTAFTGPPPFLPWCGQCPVSACSLVRAASAAPMSFGGVRRSVRVFPRTVCSRPQICPTRSHCLRCSLRSVLPRRTRILHLLES